MSEEAFKQSFDEAFFGGWGAAMGGIDALYVSPTGVPTTVQVLVDKGVGQFGDDFAPVSSYDTFVTFRRAQVEPEVTGTVLVGGVTYTLAQRVDRSDESLSKWAVQS